MPADRNFILSCLAGSLQNSPESSESFPNHFDSGPALDPRSKIQDCAGNLGSNAQPNHPNHFRIILIRARARIQDPRFPRGLARES